MSDATRGLPPAGGDPEVTHEIDELALRTERMTPMYDAARWVLVWGFRIGAVLLGVGVVLALLKGEPLGREADRIVDVPGAIAAGHAAGIIDLAILWFMAVPVVTVVVMAISFWRLGDRRYAMLSLVVLAILGVSIALALNR